MVGRMTTEMLMEDEDGEEVKLPGLPATYVENEEEAETLVIRLADPVTGLELELFYTIFYIMV